MLILQKTESVFIWTNLAFLQKKTTPIVIQHKTFHTMETETIDIHPAPESRISSTDFNNLEFGKVISDHMLIAEYKDRQWGTPSIKPFGNLSLSPATMALHYGQSVFEGLKAFKMTDGNISIFRIDKHFNRLSQSLQRMCMPQVPVRLFTEGIRQLVTLDQAWVPDAPGCSLYIRPFVFASENRVGVHVSKEYLFLILTSPVGKYYEKPLRVKVEERYVRATKGGTGYTKCAGNYGGAFYPAQLAQQEGYDQVLWTDGSPELNIEESGTMNVMFVINNILTTPPLSDTILDGITRDSIITLARHMGISVEERKTSAYELKEALKKNTLQEAFGTGTAAVTSPIATIHIQGTDYHLPARHENSIAIKAGNLMNNIRLGTEKDIFGWNTVITVP
jgi:branched-chain amino acid aminotransferase